MTTSPTSPQWRLERDAEGSVTILAWETTVAEIWHSRGDPLVTAQLIITAVNSHDALVAALSELIASVSSYAPDLGRIESWFEILDRARAALKLAEGER